MFKFSVREMILLTTIVALALGWWISGSVLASRASQAKLWEFRANALSDRVQRYGWQVTWEGESIDITHAEVDGVVRKVRAIRPGSASAAWMAKPTPPAVGLAPNANSPASAPVSTLP